MGNTESSDIHKFDGCETLGYRILGVQPDSPASRAGLVSFFDFLVGANGQLLFGVDDGSGGEYFEDVDFPALLKSSVDQEIELLVWNIKNKTQRFLTLTPCTSWGGKGLLGVTIRMDDYAVAEENLLRVLSVEKQSPAALAGLTPNTDYLLGTTVDSFESEDVLADVLEENEDSVVEIYVYNTQSDVVRVVTLIPSSNWGGKGLLGAQIGKGYLHRLPKDCRKTLGVSFERKIRVDENNTTTCGAVDLQLNNESQKDIMSKIETDESSPTRENSTEIVELNLNEKKEEGKEVVDNNRVDLTRVISDNNECKNKSNSPPQFVDHEDNPVSSRVSKFPSTPQLQDFTLIGMSKPSSSSSDVFDNDLPPPPISYNVDDSQEDELAVVDLQ